MCIRCGEAIPEPLELCTPCGMRTRIEVAEGLRELSEYLRAWSEFDLWCREKGAG